jgi:hypothetical protein
MNFVRKVPYLCAVLLIGLELLVPAVANAAGNAPEDCSQMPQGRCLNDDYFSGSWWPDGIQMVWPNNFTYTDASGSTNSWALPNSTDAGQAPGVAANNFIALMHCYLYQDSTTCPAGSGSILGKAGCPDWIDNSPMASDGSEPCYDNRRQTLGAAFIILTMLGYSGTTFTDATQGVTMAEAQFATWSSFILTNDAAGNINWDEPIVRPPGSLNSADVGTGHGVAVIIWPTPDSSDFIHIHNAQGDYLLNRFCANTEGYFTSAPPPPVTATCAGFSTSVAAPDPKQGFNLTVSVLFNPPGAATTDFGPDTMAATFNGTSKSTTTPSIAAGVASLTMAVPATNATGALPVTWSVSGPQVPTVSCSGTINIADIPYFSIPSGDIESGAPMGISLPSGGTDCTTVPTDPNAGIVSWNQEVSGNYAGAGTDYAAITMNYLQDFATAQDSTAGNAQQPTGLSFSNTSNVTNTGNGNDTYGGNFSQESCIPNFAANLSSASMVTAPSSVPLPAPAPSASGHTVFYVQGNVILSSNVAIFGGTYVNLASIPSYTIIAKGGNIYIDPGVTRLDGLYVAEPDSSGNGGNIYTCTTVPTATLQNGDSNLTVDIANYYSTCKNPLTVNGAFVAKQVWLLRTGGTLYGSNSAETFNFTPEAWLGTPYDLSTSGGSGGGYDAITSLPPTL